MNFPLVTWIRLLDILRSLSHPFNNYMSLERQDKYIKVDTCFLISGSESKPSRNILQYIRQYHSSEFLSSTDQFVTEEREELDRREGKVILFKSLRTEFLNYILKKQLSIPFSVHYSDNFP